MTAKELNAIAAKLAEQVRSNRRKAADVVPPGWFTIKDLAQATGRSGFNVSAHLKIAGAERRMFTIQGHHSLRAVPHYKLK